MELISISDDNSSVTYKPVHDLAAGQYTFYVQAKDQYGNEGSEEKMTFTIKIPELKISLIIGICKKAITVAIGVT